MKSMKEVVASLRQDLAQPPELRSNYLAPVFGSIANGYAYLLAGSHGAPLSELAARLATRPLGSLPARPPVLVFSLRGEPTARTLAVLARGGVGGQIENGCQFADQVATRCKAWHSLHDAAPSAVLIENVGALDVRLCERHQETWEDEGGETFSHESPFGWACGRSDSLEVRSKRVALTLEGIARFLDCPVLATLYVNRLDVQKGPVSSLVRQLGDLAEFHDHTMGFAFLSEDGAFAVVSHHRLGPSGMKVPLAFNPETGEFDEASM
ncbi:MAG: hypothetical protein EPO40_18825 [Myxococcaceae bacterium]|nr:MAG: hypothetical protein EPO40_18825 [Myxococcaceae bacterium]